MPRARLRRLITLAAALAAAAPARAAAQLPETEHQGAAALGLELRRLGTSKRVLMIAAHPDDENTPLLSELALGQGAEVAYLSLSRGEGGQNLIGPELQEGLGLLRTEELLAARRLDGALQFFSRAYDFGYSKTAAETFRHWPRDSLLADVVAVIRAFRPQLVISIFSGTPRDGHGQHQAAGIVAREAFAAAGDATRFPEQLARGLRPHAPAKLYQSLWTADAAGLRLATGELDPLLDASHFQVAMASRSRHRSQDMGRPEPPGPRWSGLRLEIPAPGPAEASPFQGVDTLLTMAVHQLPARVLEPARRGRASQLLAQYEELVSRSRADFNPLRPGALVPYLTRALRLLAQAQSLLAPAIADPEVEGVRFLLDAEARDARAALARAAGLLPDAAADQERVVPGQTFQLELTLWNGWADSVSLEALEPALPPGWQAAPLDPLTPGALPPGQLVRRRFQVQVPADAAITEPYYLRQPRVGDLYQWPDDPRVAGRPFSPPEFRARAALSLAGVSLTLEEEAMYRGVDKARGEFRRSIRVVPAVSLRLEPAVAVLALAGQPQPLLDAAGSAPRKTSRHSSRGNAVSGKALRTDPAPARAGTSHSATRLHFTVRLNTEAPGGVEGILRFEAPAGWTALPDAVPLRIGTPGQEQVLEIVLTPAGRPEPGEYQVRAVFTAADGREFHRGYQMIDYPHTRPRALYQPAAATVRAFDVGAPGGLSVGYIMGAGDEGPQAIAQLGLSVDPIDAAAVAAGDLDRYDVIVTGVRAYEVRPDLLRHNDRLLEYVHRGGTLIVQYNKYEYADGNFAPYPVTMRRPHDRVADEAAPVRLLEPEHPALSRPNRLGDADFSGWLQERGLYFLHTWDDRFTPLLEMADPGEPPQRGGLLVARYGRGTYVYTGLALFRQLPAAVPGAYRLLANLLALGQE